ncbi:hypothetical protein EM20IM_05480 [Candidatus Methylacidiphilum infernorum]|uniref:Uncharacterized protein n=1 Tax=Candidatus Methylacidiphilum infernorum TaxID=511746 RepID=A0ABX7PSL2_9BACT|nr:hypothetical protein [Candidatus Methylacidiphilum infernorum]QSR85971.1 hypothetical protein EM20IM_05480 [Candidatus Methylacidiphilum infernorum]
MAKTPTAFEALKVAEKQVSAESKQHLYGIIGERSPTTLTPVSWQFIYWNPHSWSRSEQITVAGGQVTQIKDGLFSLGNLHLLPYKKENTINPSKLKIDSNSALEIATKSNESFSRVKLSTVIFRLASLKGYEEACWILDFFADKNGFERSIGYVMIGAITGKVYKMKLNFSKVLH